MTREWTRGFVQEAGAVSVGQLVRYVGDDEIMSTAIVRIASLYRRQDGGITAQVREVGDRRCFRCEVDDLDWLEEEPPITVSIPGRAAAEFDGSGIGQVAAGLGRSENLHQDDRFMVEFWRAGRQVRAGPGYRVELTGKRIHFEHLRDTLEALVIACEQGEDPAGARACRIAVERIQDALDD